MGVGKVKHFIASLIYSFKAKERTAYWWDLYCKARRGGVCGAYYRYKYSRHISRFHAFIPRQTNFESCPVFPHSLYGVFISMGAKIGKNCIIFHQVTIGSNTLPGSRGYGAPTLGDNVFVGAGAKIIGGVKIGNNVRIGANCVVTSDVPDNCVVVLEKPRVIQKDRLENSFVTFGKTDLGKTVGS